MNHYLSKMRGGATLPPQPALRLVVIAWLGGFLAIAAVGLLTDASNMPLVLGSFGATCVMVFGFPDLPFSQPRNVIGGHFIATLTGLVFLTMFGPHWWSMAAALATAIALMLITRTVHPPAGSNPVIVMLTLPGWDFLITPTLLGSVIVIAVAVLYNNLIKDRSYPKYWG
ncbi:HPP family protein [Oxalicibacterium faecigallinarum]|uniref:Membrane protein n=1 Tax=Oxalicibacterium faecigallinarum TaxID=573741 RepID=A0A8J3F2J6_9BURK|nr:HPP family protein [Oxalicibacterium faecigallinarum]GGI18457.1 membrane protein [Oxalicibacterium faecigallinarum]